MNLTIPHKNPSVMEKQTPFMDIHRSAYVDDAVLDHDGLIHAVKNLADLHSCGDLNDDDFKGVLHLVLSQYVEDEVSRRFSDSFERAFHKNGFLKLSL